MKEALASNQTISRAENLSARQLHQPWRPDSERKQVVPSSTGRQFSDKVETCSSQGSERSRTRQIPGDARPREFSPTAETSALQPLHERRNILASENQNEICTMDSAGLLSQENLQGLEENPFSNSVAGLAISRRT